MPETPATVFRGTSVSIEIPENVRELATVTWKASRHESGVVHVNSTGQGVLDSTDVYVGSVTSISEPQAFAVLFDKHPEFLPQYKRSLTRDGASAIVVRVPDETKRKRHYFEFYLTPAGTFPVPPPILSMRTPTLLPEPITTSLSEELDIVLAIRHYVLTAEASGPNPDIGFWINLQPVDL